MKFRKRRKIEKRQPAAENTRLNNRPRFGGFYTLVLVLAVIIPLYGQEQTLEPLLFSEEIQQDAPVAGGIFKGVHSGRIDSPANLNTLSIVIPPGDYSHLCMFVETQDSKYYAEATFDISGNRSKERYRVHLPTKHRQLLESMPIRDISVLAYVSQGCDSTEKLYIPVQLQDMKSTKDQVMLLINSQEPSVVVRVYDLHKKRYFMCKIDTLSERQVAFNRECLMEADQRPDHLTLILVRNRFERQMKDLTIKVYLP